MSRPLVSVITATYNHQNYIVDCIRSVLGQTYDHWEMIIVDDGSSDSTLATVLAYLNSSPDPRIHLLQQPNAGIMRLHETYNRALQASSGDLIAILEGDDIWFPEKLEKQVHEMEQNPQAILCWGQAELVSFDLSDSYGIQPVEGKQAVSINNNTPVGNIFNQILLSWHLPALTVIIRRKNLESVGGFIQSHGLPMVDVPTITALSFIGPFVFVPSVLGQWRISPYQTTKTYPSEIMKGRRALAMETYARIQRERIESVTIREEDLGRYFRNNVLISLARSGRYKLIRKQFKAARKDYTEALFFPGLHELLWRLRALVGIIMSYLHLDVEWIARLMGRTNYSR